MARQVFHICTREDHPIIFRNETDFRAGMNVLAITIRMHPELTIICFELMSNHFHLLVCGTEDGARLFFNQFIKNLDHYFKAEGIMAEMTDMAPKYFLVDTQEYLRNVITYINRNASFASQSVTPYSYEWGTGRFFFSPEASKRYLACRKPLTQKQRRMFTHSRKFDETEGLYEVDGYISPLSYCDIEAAQSAFDTPGQYQQLLSKNVESSKEIAHEIGENISFTDYDLYSILALITRKQFGKSSILALKPEEKIRIARILHFEYHAGNKQLSRLLKLDITTINMLFPQK